MLESQHKVKENIHQLEIKLFISKPEDLLFVFDCTFRLLKQKRKS